MKLPFVYPTKNAHVELKMDECKPLDAGVRNAPTDRTAFFALPGGVGRAFHSSTSQLNLSRFCHWQIDANQPPAD